MYSWGSLDHTITFMYIFKSTWRLHVGPNQCLSGARNRPNHPMPKLLVVWHAGVFRFLQLSFNTLGLVQISTFDLLTIITWTSQDLSNVPTIICLFISPRISILFSPQTSQLGGLGIKQCVSRWSQRTTRPILSLSLTIEMYAYHQSSCAFYDRIAHFLGIPPSSDLVPRLVAGAILICPRITRLGAGYPWHLDGNHQTRESSSAYELSRG